MSKPTAKLIGHDGNIFNLVAIARRALIAAGQKDAAEQIYNEVQQAKNYDEALRIILKYVEVE